MLDLGATDQQIIALLRGGWAHDTTPAIARTDPPLRQRACLRRVSADRIPASSVATCAAIDREQVGLRTRSLSDLSTVSTRSSRQRFEAANACSGTRVIGCHLMAGDWHYLVMSLLPTSAAIMNESTAPQMARLPHVAEM